MGTEIAISVAREETRVAVLDSGVVTDLFGDRAKHKDFVGNIYKGKVAKVLPGMQAAFVDIGLEKAAFMHVSDLLMDAEPGDMLVEAEEDEKDSEMLRPKQSCHQSRRNPRGRRRDRIRRSRRSGNWPSPSIGRIPPRSRSRETTRTRRFRSMAPRSRSSCAPSGSGRSLRSSRRPGRRDCSRPSLGTCSSRITS